MTKMKKVILTLLSVLFLNPQVNATIFFDSEVDPLPLFSLQVFIPVGTLSPDPVQAASMALYSTVLEDGTERLTKQEFLDAMMSFGASVSFGSGRDSSSWSLSFPIIEGKDYEPLIALLEENWKRPRLTEETLAKAKVKWNAALKGSLDSDMRVAASVGRRWLGIQKFGLYPIMTEGLEEASIDTIKVKARAPLMNPNDIWAGYIGPDSHKKLAHTILTQVFSRQGEVKEGRLDRSLMLRPRAKEGFGDNKTAIIVEKTGRTQTIIFTTGVFQDFPRDKNEELALHFGGHILGFSGLGSYFGDEIRNKAGLAYTVSPLQKFYLGKPAVGFLTNPVRAKNDQTFEVIPNVQTAAYEEADIFKVLNDEVWERQWQSFRYGYRLDNSSSGARLASRRAVVTGELSNEFEQTGPEDWKISRGELSSYFRTGWKDSARVMVFMGESKELRPYIEENFPAYEIRVIPVEKTISTQSYK